MTGMPGEDDICIYKGATFITEYTWEDESIDPDDYVGITAKMQGRETYDSAETIFSIETGGNGIVVTVIAGKITVACTIPAATTEDIAVDEGVYDLILMYGGIVDPWTKGKFYVTKSVSR